MAFLTADFPARIAFGAQGGPGWLTSLGATRAGWEYRNQDWEVARHRYDVSLAIRLASDYQTVLAHFHMARGRKNAFRFRDPIDNTATISTGRLPETTEDSSGDLQMHKRYGSGADLWDRKITRPVSGTITVYRTRSGATSNATADATIAYGTGRVQMANDLAGDTYTWSGTFDVPCRYDRDEMPAVVPNKQPGGELYVDCPAIMVIEVRE